MIIYTKIKNNHKRKPYYYLQIFKEGTGVRACLTIGHHNHLLDTGIGPML
jgi:hypothetical protein